jgi:CBS-domain-containing membrane protein
VLNEELNLRKESIMIGILIAVLVAALVYAILAALTGSAIVAIVGAILVLLAGIPSGGFGFGSRDGGRA